MNKTIYADNAATTRMKQVALDAMKPYFTQAFGNASGMHKVAREAKTALEQARAEIAACINARPEEIYFTSGGTESDNLALFGALEQTGKKHIVTSAVEHHAILHTCKYLEKQGVKVDYVGVDRQGFIDLGKLNQAIDGETAIVSVMYANNEIGTIMPVAKAAEIAKAKNCLFHTDAVQAVGHIPVDVQALGVDMMSFSAHKFGGPKGIGAIYIKKGVKIKPMLHGGGHESGMRSGTENVAGAVGMATALKDAVLNMDRNIEYVSKLRDKLLDGILQIDESLITGPRENRLPGIASGCINYIEGEALIMRLDFAGICASSGSACSTASLDPSHVLLAIGLAHEVAHGSVRLSINEETTEADVDYIIEQLKKVADTLRQMSPLWNK